MRVAVTGSSGFVGSALLPLLASSGHTVVRLVRRAPRAKHEVAWDPAGGATDAAGLEGLDAVVNLAGASIAGGRWTAARKALLRSSRVGPTRRLAETLATLARPPRVLVSASAVGYYGERGSDWAVETDPPGDDFLGRLSVEWEAAAQPAAAAGIRVVHPRIGIVLDPRGGALAKMLLPFKLGLGGVLGPGTQYFSWIALDDMTAALAWLLEHEELAGGVNACAPAPVTNAELTRTLGRALGRPTLVPAPAFALRLALGELADSLLASTRMRPERLLASGFRFRFPQLEPLLRQQLGTPSPAGA
jgi:uncharacterized protein (TIGR01777 family)